MVDPITSRSHRILAELLADAAQRLGEDEAGGGTFCKSPGNQEWAGHEKIWAPKNDSPPFRLAKDGLHRTLVLYRVFMAHDMDIHARTSER